MLAIASAVVAAYQHMDMKELAIPFLPVGVIGTAVAFYVGFKNNHSYERLWEARKVWGSITNDSRLWASYSIQFISNLFAEKHSAESELMHERRQLVMRHLAWINALRTQLRVHRSWEHSYPFNFEMRRRMDEVFDHKPLGETMATYVGAAEASEHAKAANAAAQLLHRQGCELKRLREQGLIDDFRFSQMQEVIGRLFDHQGKVERLKNFPFPRQYASFSEIFIWIFIGLLPFGLVHEFARINSALVWLAVPCTLLIGWFFMTMELVADYSESPFESSFNDVPMTAMCRAIEIDLLEMLGERHSLKPLEPVNDILM